MTATTEALDAALRHGARLHVWRDGYAVVVEIRGYGETTIPADIRDRALAGETIQWTARGYTYESTGSRFPNGEPCVSTSIVDGPPGRNGADPWMWDVKQTGRGATFAAALTAALAAEPIEVSS